MGGECRQDLTPEEMQWQQYLDQQVRPVIVPERASRCPYSHEDWIRFEQDSCFNRYQKMYDLYFKLGNKGPRDHVTPIHCTICGLEQKHHPRDGSLENQTEEEKWQPKCKEPCPQTQRTFNMQK